MFHPSKLRPETIQKNIDALRACAHLTMEERTRVYIRDAQTLMMNGVMFDREDMWLRGWELVRSLKYQEVM